MLPLAENILMIRSVLGYTQEEFSHKIDPLKGTKGKVYSYEKGVASPPKLTLQRIAEFTGIPVDDLMTKKLKESDINKDYHAAPIKIPDFYTSIIENQIQLIAGQRVILSILAELQAPVLNRMPTELLSIYQSMVRDTERAVESELRKMS